MVGAWQPGNWIVLAGIAVAAAAALLAAWLNGVLSRRVRRDEQLRRWRRDAASALGPMLALIMDAEPSLVFKNPFHEYESSRDAVEVLRSRWLRAREPLLVVSLGQVSREMRDLGIELQGEVGDLLRLLDAATDPSSELERIASTNEAYTKHAAAWDLAVQLCRELYR
jgi:hypothetical protein